MERNRKISQTFDKANEPSISQHSEKRMDFATGYNMPGKEKERTMQPESSKDYPPSETHLHSERQTSSARQRNETAHPESECGSASANEMEGHQVWQLGQDSPDLLAAWLQKRYESAKPNAIIYNEQEITTLEVNLAKHNESIGDLENKTNKTEQKVEELDDKIFGLWAKALGYEGVYFDQKEELNITKKEFDLNKNKEDIHYNNIKEEYFLLKDDYLNFIAKYKSLQEDLDRLNVSMKNKLSLILQSRKVTFVKDNSFMIIDLEDAQKILNRRLKDLYEHYYETQNKIIECQKSISSIEKEEKERSTFEKDLRAIDFLEDKARMVRDTEKNAFESSMAWDQAKQAISQDKKYIEILQEAQWTEDVAKLEQEHKLKEFEKCIQKLDTTQLGSLSIKKEVQEQLSGQKISDVVTSQANSSTRIESLQSLEFKEWLNHYKEVSEKWLNDAEKKSLEHIIENHSPLLDYVRKEIEHSISIKQNMINSITGLTQNIKENIKAKESHKKKLEDNIANYDRDLQKVQSDIDNQNRDLRKLRLSSDYIDNLSRFKEDELAHFDAQLHLIETYGQGNNLRDLKDHISHLYSQKQELNDKKNKIEELKKDHMVYEQKIAQFDIIHKIFLKERTISILDYELDNESFKNFKYQNLYEEKNIQSSTEIINDIEKKINILRTKRIQIKEKLEKLECGRMLTINKIIEAETNFALNERKLLMGFTQRSNNLQKEISEIQENLSQNKNKAIASKLQSELKSKKRDLDKATKLMNDKKDSWFNNIKHSDILYDLMNKNNNFLKYSQKMLLSNRDEIEKCKLDIFNIGENQSENSLDKIAAYESEAKAYEAGIADLKSKIATELTQIKSRFETDLQNGQKSRDEKEAELESLHSKLKNLEKSIQQQAIQQQKLQKKQNLRIKATESIAQELKYDRQKLEKMGEELANAKQEITHSRTNFEEYYHRLGPEEKLEIAKSEWEKARSELLQN